MTDLTGDRFASLRTSVDTGDRFSAAAASSGPACSCHSTSDMARAALEGVELEACVVHTPGAAAAPGSSLALNDDDGLARVIHAAFGGGNFTRSSGNFDPFDAA